MADISSSTTVSIEAAPETLTESGDLILIAENEGLDLARELHYPADVLPPIIYPEAPWKTENFDTIPLTARPTVKGEQTLQGNLISVWPGYGMDKMVREIWTPPASNAVAMWLSFFRLLWNYSANIPDNAYIEWWPRDRTTAKYNIIISSLTVGGTELNFDMLALYHEMVLAEVVLSFYIVGEVTE